jgi:PPOX class probable F420-dependent enzyme
MTAATAAPLNPSTFADVPIPMTHADLFGRAICGVLTTIGPGGQPESSLVWVDLDGGCPRVNTTLERRKGRNVQRDPRVSLLLVEPENTARFIQVRGVVELVTAGALGHLDTLVRAYTGREHYYGGIYPVEQARRETRVICRIHPSRVTLDAIHAGRRD